MLFAVRHQSVEEVVARIEQVARDLPESPRGVVATDGDGTLWSGDVGEDLFEAFVEHARVEPAAHEAMVRAATSFGIDEGGTGAMVARRIWDAYHKGSLPEEPVFELMAWCFASWSRADVNAFARDVVVSAGVAARLHPEVADVLAAVRAANIEIFLVSASPRPIIEAAGALVGIASERVVATTPRWDGEAMLADVERPIPYGAGKVHGLRARIGDRPLYAAFGDNAFDLMMLRDAKVPVAVRPKAKLRARAAEVESLVELLPPPHVV